jgi:hypothetical protein
MKKAGSCLIAVVLAVVVTSGPASAQEKLKQVWVMQTDSGDVVRGSLVELSPASLAVLTRDSRRVEIPMDRVLRIETGGDSLKNGAAIGAVVLGGLVLATCASWDGGGDCIVAAAVDAGVGALIGAGVDAMIDGRTAIYSRAASQPAAKAASTDKGKTASIGFRIRF